MLFERVVDACRTPLTVPTQPHLHLQGKHMVLLLHHRYLHVLHRNWTSKKRASCRLLLVLRAPTKLAALLCSSVQHVILQRVVVPNLASLLGLLLSTALRTAAVSHFEVRHVGWRCITQQTAAEITPRWGKQWQTKAGPLELSFRGYRSRQSVRQ